jgi:predicted transcriptional regulator
MSCAYQKQNVVLSIRAKDFVMTDAIGPNLIELTTEIVAAYLGGNELPPGEVPALITTVHNALVATSDVRPVEIVQPEQVPAVPPRKSVFPDHIVCLEDGKRFKSLKRHLMSSYNLTPEQYRAKWGLPADYPMVAPDYAKARSQLAKKIGLGRGRR